MTPCENLVRARRRQANPIRHNPEPAPSVCGPDVRTSTPQVIIALQLWQVKRQLWIGLLFWCWTAMMIDKVSVATIAGESTALKGMKTRDDSLDVGLILAALDCVSVALDRFIDVGIVPEQSQHVRRARPLGH